MVKAYNNGETARVRQLPSTRFYEKYHIARPQLFWLFFFGSLFGVLMEGVYCKIVHGAWETHVVSMWGPFCILYGFGAEFYYIANVVMAKKKVWQKFLVFGCLGSGIEVIAGALLEYGLGKYAWDYSAEFLNFRGYCSLRMTAVWGALGLLFGLFIGPLDAIYAHMQGKWWHITYVLLSIFMVINLTFTALCLSRWGDRTEFNIPPRNRFEQYIDKKYDDEYMQHRFIEWHSIQWKRS